MLSARLSLFNVVKLRKGCLNAQVIRGDLFSRCCTMSSDEDASPAMQFTRSVRRTGRKALASPSDSENTPRSIGAPVHPGRQQQHSSASGYVGQQLLLGSSPGSPSLVKVGTPQAAAAVLQPLPVQQSAVQPGALQTPPYHSPARHPLQQLQACAGSPATPAAAQQVPLDLNDPYTPWLRTSRKPPLATPGASSLTQAGMITAGLQVSCLSSSPAYSASSSLNSSPRRSIAAGDSSGSAHAADALASLCHAVADLQLRQEVSSPAANSTAAGVASLRGAAASAAAVAAAGPQDSLPATIDGTANTLVCPGLLPKPLPPASRQAATPANTAVQEAASSSDDDAGPLTLGRRTQPRVFRRPLLVADTDTSSSSSSGDEGGQCSSTGHAQKHTGNCGGSSTHRRITPGSTSSLVARRPGAGSSGRSKHRPAPGDTGYTGAYDFDVHLSAIKPPRWQMQQRERYLEQAGMTAAAGGHSRCGGSSSTARTPYSSFSPESPVATLPFSTLRGPQAAAAAAAVPTPDSPVGAPRRPSQFFLGAGLPLSPPVLKQQPQQSAGCVTPTVAVGRRRGHTAQTERKPRAAATACDATADKDALPQGFGQVLWPLSGHASTAGLTSSSCGGSMQASDFTPSHRRAKDAAKDAAGTGKAGDRAADRKKPAAAPQPKTGTREAGGRAPGPKNAAAVRATAPPKAPSSRTFARQRQQLAQDLYTLWNAQVFDCGLPADLAVVWNPRLTATAGQVVDDGSRNSEKSSRDQRIPVRLELSAKVIDNEARLRTTLSHEMCHVAAWVISKEWKQHHGDVFWAWARRFEHHVPGIKITTCHNYEVHTPFRWQCSNHSCGKLYMRHRRSIDTNKHVCSRCSGRLLYLGKFSRDGKLVTSRVPDAAAGGSATPGGGNAFAIFVKMHFAELKRDLPTGTPHKEVMSRLATQYKGQKLSTAAKAAGAAAGAVAGDDATPAGPATVSRAGLFVAAAYVSDVPVSAERSVAVRTPDTEPVMGGAAAAAAAAVAAQAAGEDAAAAGAKASASEAADSDDDGWQTAEEEVEEQTSSLLSFMDRLALA